MEHYSVAIDGPSGVGKSTIAKRLAKRLYYAYIDTGAMYRALAVYFMENGIDIHDEAAVAESLKDVEVTIRYELGEQHVYVNGEDATGRLRTEEISAAASLTSSYQPVRDRLLELQRSMAESQDVIMDGRDIGTVVLPNATLKVFLTATDEVRAKRRYRQLEEAGTLDGRTLADIQKEMAERDYRDSHRANAPLKMADDAVLVDNSKLTADETETKITALLFDRIGYCCR